MGHFPFFSGSFHHSALSGKGIRLIKCSCINSPPVRWTRTPQQRWQSVSHRLNKPDNLSGIHSFPKPSELPAQTAFKVVKLTLPNLNLQSENITSHFLSPSLYHSPPFLIVPADLLFLQDELLNVLAVRGVKALCFLSMCG